MVNALLVGKPPNYNEIAQTHRSEQHFNSEDRKTEMNFLRQCFNLVLQFLRGSVSNFIQFSERQFSCIAGCMNIFIVSNWREENGTVSPAESGNNMHKHAACMSSKQQANEPN